MCLTLRNSINYFVSGLKFLQDSLVVCRLRKNNEFRLNDAANQGSPSQRHLAITNNNNNSTSEVGIDHAGISDGDRAVECSSKKCSSSHGSYSIEQIDSESDSDQRPTNEVSQPKSSSHQKVCYISCPPFPLPPQRK